MKKTMKRFNESVFTFQHGEWHLSELISEYTRKKKSRDSLDVEIRDLEGIIEKALHLITTGASLIPPTPPDLKKELFSDLEKTAEPDTIARDGFSKIVEREGITLLLAEDARETFLGKIIKSTKPDGNIEYSSAFFQNGAPVYARSFDNEDDALTHLWDQRLRAIVVGEKSKNNYWEFHIKNNLLEGNQLLADIHQDEDDQKWYVVFYSHKDASIYYGGIFDKEEDAVSLVWESANKIF